MIDVLKELENLDASNPFLQSNKISVLQDKIKTITEERDAFMLSIEKKENKIIEEKEKPTDEIFL